MSNASHNPTTFNVRLFGEGISPGTVPLRTLSRLLSAIQRLLEPGSAKQAEKPDLPASVHLVQVAPGSAIYECLADSPEHIISRLTLVGKYIQDPDSYDLDSSFLSSIEDLSEAAKSLNCKIEIINPLTFNKDGVLAKIEPETYSTVSENAYVTGYTTLLAKIERAGGATDMHCGIRLHTTQRKMVICSVDTQELVRDLGMHLYEDVYLEGYAKWIRSTMELKRLRITGMRPIHAGPVLDALKEIRDAGANVWDDIDNIADTIGRD